MTPDNDHRTVPAAAYFGAPVDAPTPTPAPQAAPQAPQADPAPQAVTDPAPALAGVAPEFGATPEPAADGTLPEVDTDGVDVSTFPGLADMRRLMPSVRLKMQMNAAKIATGLPEGLADGTGLNIADLKGDDLDALSNLFDGVENAVLDAATDRAAMANWLLEQRNPFNAVMYAFSRYTESLGN